MPRLSKVVIGMSKRSREARALAKALWTYWGYGAGWVDVRWTDGWFKGSVYRQGWEIAWSNGPTVPRMRQAAHQVPAGPAIGELVHEDLVRYERWLTEAAWAASLVRHVRDGATVPDLADLRTEQAWRETLERTEFPERARTLKEQALVGVLLRRGVGEYCRGVDAIARAWDQERRILPAPPPVELLMSRALATFGLDALVALEPTGNVVELPIHGVDRDDGLGAP
jgi:hypothetical protein